MNRTARRRAQPMKLSAADLERQIEAARVIVADPVKYPPDSAMAICSRQLLKRLVAEAMAREAPLLVGRV